MNNDNFWNDELVKEFAQIWHGDVSFEEVKKDLMSKAILNFKQHIQSKQQSNKVKLFTTFDGKDIYEGDEAFWINKDWRIGSGIFRDAELRVNYKHFSTEEAAKKYIKKHQPKYSEEDMRKCFESAQSKFVMLSSPAMPMGELKSKFHFETFEKYLQSIKK